MGEAPVAGAAAAVRRAALLDLTRTRFDLLIIGGGSVGAGSALQAAARGLRVALVEGEDFGSGTSGRSTKLAHGGVRYLERAVLRADVAEYRLVREALHERAAFFRLAPHLCRDLPILTPAYSTRDLAYYLAGLRLYDLLAAGRGLGRTSAYGPAEAARLFPGLRAEGLRGAVLYHDGQFDDARFNVALAVTAARWGATVVNHARARGLLWEQGRIVGAEVEDRLSGAALPVRAAAVLNATGPCADLVRGLAAPGLAPLLRVSRGVHLVLGPGRCSDGTGLLIPRTPDGRVVFVLPWLRHTLIGTTDGPGEPSPHPPVPAEDIAYLLAQVNAHLQRPIDAAEILSAWSGLRPLARDPRRGRTSELSRGHVVVDGPPGLVTVVGGKWTTYRRIAADAVAHVVRRFGLAARAGSGACELPLVGAESCRPSASASVSGSAVEGPALARRFALPPATVAHLLSSYGDRAAEVCVQGGAGGLRPLVPTHPYLEADVLWGARREWAQTVLDVLARRTRLAFLDRAAARAAVPRVAALLAGELAWTVAERQRQEADAHRRLGGDL